MSEATSHFFVLLSHQWSQYLLPLPLVFGGGMYLAGKLQVSTRNNPKAFLAARVFRGTSLIGLLGSLTALGASFLHLGCAVAVSRSNTCISNVKALSLAMLMYAQDSSDCFPPSNRWSEGIASYLGRSEVRSAKGPFHCPASDSPFGYGLNAAVGGTSLLDTDAPAETALLFDANANIRSFAGGTSAVTLNRHSGGANMSFMDGQTKWTNSYALAKIKWAPDRAKAKHKGN